jgi:NAD(P)H-dependent flavin oxidoreductase YrpB (nitropropane dioxygenase family)
MEKQASPLPLIAAGVLADRVGLSAAFVAGGAVIAVAALLPPREELRARARTPLAE